MPKRFSLRTMLVGVAIVAATTFAIKEHLRLKEARQQFEWVWANWQFVQVTADDVVEASELLLAAEGASPWISHDAAKLQHVERLTMLLQHHEARMYCMHPDTKEQIRQRLRAQIEKYSAPAAKQ